MTTLETDELILRPWREEDAPELFELARDPEAGVAANWTPLASVEEGLAAIRGVLRAPESWAVEDARTGELLGAAALRDATRPGGPRRGASVELVFWIGRPFRGYGYGTQVANELVRHAVQDLGATRVWAACSPDSERASAVLRACGLTRAAKADGSGSAALLDAPEGQRREAAVWELLVRRTLFVDADACPVTEEALACARRAGVPVVIAGNTTQNLERHIRRDDPRDPAHARGGFWVDVLDVSVGADSADFAIVERLSPGDVVVTQDIGLASMALGRGAAAVSVRGHVFRRETIDAELLVRHEEKRVRRAGGRTGGPRAFASADRRRFTASLGRVLLGQA